MVLTANTAVNHRSFNHICRMALTCIHLIYGSLGPCKSVTQMAYQLPQFSHVCRAQASHSWSQSPHSTSRQPTSSTCAGDVGWKLKNFGGDNFNIRMPQTTASSKFRLRRRRMLELSTYPQQLHHLLTIYCQLLTDSYIQWHTNNST